MLDFSLPSGLHNVWGAGNDFDTNAYRIHPGDLDYVLGELKCAVCKLQTVLCNGLKDGCINYPGK